VRRLLLVLGVSLSFGAMCGGIGAEEPVTDEPGDDADEEEDDKEVVVVPVRNGDPDAFCCAFDDDGTARYALTDGATACADQYGDDDGEWLQDIQCTPCCCDLGGDHDLMTANSCARAEGECKGAGHPACGGKGRKGKGKAKRPEPEPEPKPNPGRRKMRKPADD